MSTFLGKQNGRAEATEKRPTILLVVGPAEQFPKVTAPSRERSSLGAGLGSFFQKWEKEWVWEGELKKKIQFGIGEM
jgi:hypothetical protein